MTPFAAMMLAATVLLLGCDHTSRTDAGSSRDAGPADAGPAGDGGHDAGARDAAAPDDAGTDAGTDTDGGACTGLCSGSDVARFRCADNTECCPGLECQYNTVEGASYCMPIDAPDPAGCPATEPTAFFSCDVRGMRCTYGTTALLCACVGWVPDA